MPYLTGTSLSKTRLMSSAIQLYRSTGRRSELPGVRPGNSRISSHGYPTNEPPPLPPAFPSRFLEITRSSHHGAPLGAETVLCPRYPTSTRSLHRNPRELSTGRATDCCGSYHQRDADRSANRYDYQSSLSCPEVRNKVRTPIQTAAPMISVHTPRVTVQRTVKMLQRVAELFHDTPARLPPTYLYPIRHP